MLFFCCTAYSQQLNFDSYNKNDGLVSNEVHAISQGSNGYMYFGTPAGLSEFDGAFFTNYNLSKGFRDNIVSGIQQLAADSVVLFTRSNQFYYLAADHLTIDSEKIAVKNIYPTGDGSWYACTYSGLYLFRNKHFTKLPVEPGGTFLGINCVMQWQDSFLVVGRSYEPLDIYNRYTWKHVAASAEKLFVRDLCKDAGGNVWIASIGAGILLLTPASIQNNLVRFEKLPAIFEPFRQSEFRAIVQDKTGNLWMGSTNKGLLRYNPATGRLLQITTGNGLLSNTIFSLYCDSEDNCWIGTNRGLQKLQHYYTTSYTSRQGLPADLVLDAFSLPGGRIISCGYYGVGYLNGNSEKITTWKPPLEDENFSSFAVINGVHFGLSLRKLIALKIGSGSITANHVYGLPEHTRAMTLYDGNKLLLGGENSILSFTNGQLQVFSKDSVHDIKCMATGSEGMVWAANLNNTVCGYQQDKKGVNIKFHCRLQTQGQHDFIQCITTAGNNRLLCGSAQSGILILQHQNKVLRQTGSISVASGLSSNDVESFCWYNDTTLLAGTGSGLCKIIFPLTTDSFYIRNISEFYNFANTVYSIEKEADGSLLLGTEAGITTMPAVDIERRISGSLPISISSVQLLGYPDSLVDARHSINLSYKNNGITVFYASPSFVNEKSIRYTYLLTGSNQVRSSQPSTSNHVTFLNLSPGHYRFIVRAVNTYGGISSRAAGFALIIQPPFWQTWWFITLLALALSALVYAVVKRRIYNIRRESALKNKIAETEMMALRAQMNPHFIFNCMNIIDGLITGNRQEEAQDFLQKFSKLIRLVLENSQYQQVPLQQDLQALQLYTELECIRSNHHFTYTFDIDEELVENDYRIPPLLLQPYVENAIVHGLRNKEYGPGKLLVSIKKQQGKIIAIIEDNGAGRQKAIQLNEANKKPHQQIGMRVTGKRISLLRMVNRHTVQIDVTDASAAAEPGTRVVITLPERLKFE